MDHVGDTAGRYGQHGYYQRNGTTGAGQNSGHLPPCAGDVVETETEDKFHNLETRYWWWYSQQQHPHTMT
jgi:hypothetical protein